MASCYDPNERIPSLCFNLNTHSLGVGDTLALQDCSDCWRCFRWFWRFDPGSTKDSYTYYNQTTKEWLATRRNYIFRHIYDDTGRFVVKVSVYKSIQRAFECGPTIRWDVGYDTVIVRVKIRLRHIAVDFNACRDMCKEMGMKQKCFSCHWKCNYNKGKFVGVSWISESKLPCCPGTQQKPCSHDEKTAASTCPTCYVCGWDCLYHEGKKKWKLIAQTQDKDGLLCCAGTPDRDISKERECENKNRKEIYMKKCKLIKNARILLWKGCINLLS